MWEEDGEADESDLTECDEETIEDSPGPSQWPSQGYQPEVYFAEATNITDQTEYVEAVTLGLPKGAAFLVTTAGTLCNALIDTGVSHSCRSESFCQELILLKWNTFFVFL